MDVEGCELDVLLGMDDATWRMTQRVVAEVTNFLHGGQTGQPADLARHMRACCCHSVKPSGPTYQT